MHVEEMSVNMKWNSTKPNNDDKNIGCIIIIMGYNNNRHIQLHGGKRKEIERSRPCRVAECTLHTMKQSSCLQGSPQPVIKKWAGLRGPSTVRFYEYH